MIKYKIGGVRSWFIVASAAFFYTYQFVLRVSPNIARDDIMDVFNVDATTFGFIVGLYYWTYAGMQLPLGISMDRFGPRRLVAGAGIMCGIACYLFAHTNNIYIAGLARLMIGMGGACGLLGTLKLGSLWIPPKQFAQVVALAMIFGTMGAIAGEYPLLRLVEYAGWKRGLEILGIIGILMGVLNAFVLRDSPKDRQGRREDRQNAAKRKTHIMEGLYRVIKMPQAWIISVYGMFMYIPIVLLGDAWGVGLLQSIYGVDERVGASIIGAMFLGASFGSPIFTTFSDYVQKRRTPMIWGTVLCFSVHSIIIFVDNIPLYFMYGLFFAAGFLYTAKSLSFASIVEIMPRAESGVAVGFTNMVVMISGVIFHPFVGRLLDYRLSQATLVNGVAAQTESDYRFALAIIPITLFLSLICLFFMKETHPARQHHRAKHVGKD